MTVRRHDEAPFRAERAEPTHTVGVPLAVVAVLYVLALGGRFSGDRLGWTVLGDLDLRIPGAVFALVVLLVWRLGPARSRWTRRLSAGLPWMVLLLTWLALSAFWAPPGARLGPGLVNLLVLVVLALGVGLLNATDADATARALLWCGYVSGVVYALAGLVLAETNVQGRLTAFGGGPNVFARVVGVGIIAAIVLYALTRWRSVLLALPILAVALLLSGSRGAVVAGAVAALAFVVLFPARRSGRGIALLVVLTSLTALVVATFLPAVVGLVQERYTLTLAGDDSGRGLLLGQAWNLLSRDPALGTGLDGYWATFGRSLELDYPHNLVLEIGATGGAVALVLMAAFVVGVVVGVRPLVSLPLERVGMLVLAVFMFVASMFSGDLYDSRFFWLFALAATGITATTLPPGTRHS